MLAHQSNDARSNGLDDPGELAHVDGELMTLERQIHEGGTTSHVETSKAGRVELFRRRRVS